MLLRNVRVALLGKFQGDNFSLWVNFARWKCPDEGISEGEGVIRKACPGIPTQDYKSLRVAVITIRVRQKSLYGGKDLWNR